MASFIYSALYWASIGIIVYMAGVVIFYFLFFVISGLKVRHEIGLNRQESLESLRNSVDTFPVSILIPAYNEEVGIVNTVRSLLSLNYPEFEVIVIDDGSRDATSERMIKQFEMKKVDYVLKRHFDTEQVQAVYRSSLYPKLTLLKKDNGGKSDALNAGINFSTYPYFCAIDADSVLERDALLKVMKPILDTNGEVIAVGGSIRIANGCRISRGHMEEVRVPKETIATMQIIEYFRAFLIGRIGLSRYNLMLIISGAYGVFQKSWVINVGGYSRLTVGEDMELVVRLQRQLKETNSNQRIEYVPDSICWTEAPTSLRILRKQRRRWQQGLTETLITHRSLLFNPKYRGIGFISFPYFLFIELFGAIVELLGYIILILGVIFVFINIEVAVLLLAASFLYGSFLSASAVLLEEWTQEKYEKSSDLLKLYLYALTETFWYRPLTVIWRVEGIISALLKSKEWGEMSRKGISSDD